MMATHVQDHSIPSQGHNTTANAESITAVAMDARQPAYDHEKHHHEKQADLEAEEESINDALGDERDADSSFSRRGVQDVEKAEASIPAAERSTTPRPTTAQDWNGKDDPDNPQNWAIWFRALHILPIAFLSFAVTAGSSMITPATPEIERYFGVSRTAAVLSLSMVRRLLCAQLASLLTPTSSFLVSVLARRSQRRYPRSSAGASYTRVPDPSTCSSFSAPASRRALAGYWCADCSPEWQEVPCSPSEQERMRICSRQRSGRYRRPSLSWPPSWALH